MLHISLCVLILLLARSAFSSASSQECTQGFMDYELLSVKAAQIGDSTIDDTVYRFGISRYVMPNLNFTCSGTITGFLLAVDIRIDNGRNEYPWIGLFYRVHPNHYRIVSGSKRDIILGPDDFSTSGLYNYTLSSPIQFTSGNIIGVQQFDFDDSVVALRLQSYSSDYIEAIVPGYVHYDHLAYFQNYRFLCLPITDNPECLSDGFISYEDLQVNARLATSVSGSYIPSLGPHRFFKQIGFTCNCSITHVIAGMKDTISQSSNPSAITIWRRSNTDSDTYTQSGPTIPLYYSDAVSDISTDYLRWYNLSVPVPVKEGDVLGIYFYTPINEADALIYYQVYSGPHNYYDSSTSNQATGYNSYPLVSVIVSNLPTSVTMSSNIDSLPSATTSTIDLPTLVTMSSNIDSLPSTTTSTAGVALSAISMEMSSVIITATLSRSTTDSAIATIDARTSSATNHIAYSDTISTTVISSSSSTLFSLRRSTTISDSLQQQQINVTTVAAATTVCFVILLSLGILVLIISIFVCYYRTKHYKKRINVLPSETKRVSITEGIPSDCIILEDNCNNPCELSEAIYEPIDQTQHTCDCIAASNGAGSDSKSLMNSKDTCAVKQWQSMNTKGGKNYDYEQPISIKGLTALNDCYGVKQQPMYIEGENDSHEQPRSIKGRLTLNDRYAVKQQPMYIEGETNDGYEKPINIKGLPSNDSCTVKQQSMNFESGKNNAIYEQPINIDHERRTENADSYAVKQAQVYIEGKHYI